MARKQQIIETIEQNSFMGLLASKGQIPDVTAPAVAADLRSNGRIFEVVGQKQAKAKMSLRIVRPSSWGKVSGGNGMSGGAFAH